MTTYDVPDMSCGHCKAAINETLHSLDPKARIDFDMNARRISVDSSLTGERITEALAAIGYPASEI